MDKQLQNNTHWIIERLPYASPFLFVDHLDHISENGVEGRYTFTRDSCFYRGHFKEVPVTPGVILTECCAQIGLVCLGIYLLGKTATSQPAEALQVAFSSSEMEFYVPVWPGETVKVVAEKEYFRFHKLKCKVKLFNARGTLACKGVLAGMLKLKMDET